MRRIWRVLRTMGSREWLLPTIVVIVGMGVLARLGVWQLDRLDQRRAANAALQAALDAPPISLNEAELPGDVSVLKDRFVMAQGVYDLSAQVIVKLQNFQGRPGAYLLTPLVLDGGNTAVLVNRGWIPESEKENLAQFDETGSVLVEGIVGLTQTLHNQLTSQSTNQPTNEFFRVDIALIQQQMPYPLLPIYVIESPPESDDTDLPFQLTREIDLSEGPHLGYAIQWFMFSLMLAVVYGIMVNKKVGK
ncbi:MAG: SURF1 family protein [Anaerolineae bacterium]